MERDIPQQTVFCFYLKALAALKIRIPRPSLLPLKILFAHPRCSPSKRKRTAFTEPGKIAARLNSMQAYNFAIDKSSA